jgi:hypothetical protein
MSSIPSTKLKYRRLSASSNGFRHLQGDLGRQLRGLEARPPGLNLAVELGPTWPGGRPETDRWAGQVTRTEPVATAAQLVELSEVALLVRSSWEAAASRRR